METHSEAESMWVPWSVIVANPHSMAEETECDVQGDDSEETRDKK